jgi:YYY domain-containing protein
MFGTSFVPILIWMLWRARSRGEDWKTLVGIGLGVPAALLVISWIVAGIAAAVRPDLVANAIESFNAPDVRTAISGVLLRRLTTSWTALVLGLLLALAALFLRRHAKETSPTQVAPPWAFVALMAIVGALLVIGPEFLYLKDLFNVRMNTVFKFYFAAWILWGLAAAYVVTELWPRERSWGGALRAAACLVVVLGLVYTVTATWSKVEGFRPTNGQTLDGTAHLSWENPSDYAAIQWMNANLRPGVVAEAVGGSYSYGGRVSVHTGFPTVIGWPWHEVQWRGDARFLGTREDDMRRLYQSRDWLEAESIISQYGIEYVYVGDLERDTYGAIQEQMFAAFMDTIYLGDGVTIYAVRDTG